MSTTQHTPHDGLTVRSEDTEEFVLIPKRIAKLAESQPDLLAACKQLVSRFRPDSKKYVKATYVIAEADKAIARAEEGQP